ncbi:hypothetical protein ABFT23_02205 [Nocardioides sp. C4-1]
MQRARKLALALAATALSLSVIGLSAPAHADSSWGPRPGPTKPPATTP